MSSKRPPFNDYKYQKQTILSRSSEPTKRFCSKINSAKKSGRFSHIRNIKETESSLMKENQDWYMYRYTLQDEPDDSNIVFFDANSRKFRTRSSEKPYKTKSLMKTFNKGSNIKTGNIVKKYTVIRHTKSNSRNKNQELLKNKGITYNPVSNKKNIDSSYESYGKNSKERKEIIKQLKKEKDELFKSPNSNMKNKSTQSIYTSKNSKINNLNNINTDSSKFSANKNNGTSNQKIINLRSNDINIQANKNSTNKYNNNTYEKPLSNIKNFSPKLPSKFNKNTFKQSSPNNMPQNNYNNKNTDTPQKNQTQNLDQYQELNHNVETSEKKEERTLVLVPGQTIEKKSVVENFENPIEEIIENPDGTVCSVIKQTKVTTITENIPIEENKIKSIEGAPELPMYKQKITHLYETVSSMKKKENLNGINSFSKQGANGNYDGINKNIYKDGQFDEDEMNEANSKIKGRLGVALSGIKEERHFDASVLPKGFKNEKELEKFLDNMNQKGDNLSPQEKAKRFNCIKELFNNIVKGKNQEENIEKLAELLTNMNKKDRKEILEKLAKDPKNINLLKKLQNSLDKVVSINNTLGENAKYGFNKGLSGSKEYASGYKSTRSENVEVKEINPLKFDGLFLEISNYGNEKREKNPFDGPSPYIDFYKERKIKIKEKINNLVPDSFDKTERKLKDN